MINYLNKNKSNIFLTILFVIIINVILKSEILYDFIWESHELFGDHGINISWLKWNYRCYNVYQDNNNFLLKFNLGHIFLLLPFF